MLCNKISIRHVDDKEEFLQAIKAFLWDINDNVKMFTVSSPREALIIFESIMRDVIVSENYLLNVTGIELLEELQKRDDTTHDPFVILSGTYQDEIGIEGRKLGIVYYLRKNVDPDDLFAEFSKLILQFNKKFQSSLSHQ
ncbi:MAG: response regulator [Candidatus Hodarchaeales archaeon]|jgi:response regulator RpfG family c-di-GMP phosphodiesterase